MPQLVNWELLAQPYNWIIVTLILALVVGTLCLLAGPIERVGFGPLSPFIDR